MASPRFLRIIPRVNDIQTKVGKIPHIACYKAQAMVGGRCGNQAVNCGDRATRCRNHTAPMISHRMVDRKNAAGEKGRQLSLQPVDQNCTPIRVTQAFDPFTNFAKC